MSLPNLLDRNRATLKLLFVGLLSLAMLIPLTLVRGVIAERQRLQAQAASTIAQRWGGQQTVSGLVALTETTVEIRDTQSVETRSALRARVLSDLDIDAVMTTEWRYLGIYQVPVFTAELTVSGVIDWQVLDEFQPDGDLVFWLPLGDVRGVREISGLELAGRSIPARPLGVMQGPGANGMALPVANAVNAAVSGLQFTIPAELRSQLAGSNATNAPDQRVPAGVGRSDTAERTAGRGDDRGDTPAGTERGSDGRADLAPSHGAAGEVATTRYRLTLKLAGSGCLLFLPLADTTAVTLDADWPHPEFVGQFLPAERTVGESTTARWNLLGLNRPYGDEWLLYDMAPHALAAAGFGMRLETPVDGYRKSERSVKYGVLFIALTFFTLFLFEVMTGRPLHPVPYVLTGAALAVFYLVLLALSEYLAYPAAFALACALLLAIVTPYSGAVLGRRRWGLLVGAMMGVTYGLLYVLVSAEHAALLLGALALLAAIAALMYLTRRVDWYGYGGSDNERSATAVDGASSA